MFGSDHAETDLLLQARTVGLLLSKRFPEYIYIRNQSAKIW